LISSGLEHDASPRYRQRGREFLPPSPRGHWAALELARAALFVSLSKHIHRLNFFGGIVAVICRSERNIVVIAPLALHGEAPMTAEKVRNLYAPSGGDHCSTAEQWSQPCTILCKPSRAPQSEWFLSRPERFLSNSATDLSPQKSGA